MHLDQTSFRSRVRLPLLLFLGLLSLLGPVELAPAQNSATAPTPTPATPSASAPPATPQGDSGIRLYDPTKLEGITVGNLIFKREKTLSIIVATGEYRILVIEALRSRGLNALGAESVVFGVDRSDEARFLLSGTILDLDCDRAPPKEGVGYVTATCTMKLKWEILDRTRGQVVYERISSPIHRGTDNIADHIVKLVVASVNDMADRVRFLTLLRRSEVATQENGTPKLTANPCPSPSSSILPLEAALNASVAVKTSTGTGSAFIISPDGLAVTNHHVVENETDVRVVLRSGLELPAQVVRRAGLHDLAMLKIDGDNHACIHLADKAPEVGAPVLVVGAPLGQAFSSSVTRGVVSGFRDHQAQQWVQTDASINPGNSGGPMLTEDGRVVAVVSAKLSKAGIEGIGFGISSQQVVEALGIQWQRRFSPRDAVSVPRSAEFFASDRIQDMGDNPSVDSIASLYASKPSDLSASAPVSPPPPKRAPLIPPRIQVSVGGGLAAVGIATMMVGNALYSSDEKANLIRAGAVTTLVGAVVIIRGVPQLNTLSARRPSLFLHVSPTTVAMAGQF